MAFAFKPIVKFGIKHPLFGVLMITLLYIYIGQRLLRSAWEYNYGRTATNEEMGARWQQTMGLTVKDAKEATESRR